MKESDFGVAGLAVMKESDFGVAGFELDRLPPRPFESPIPWAAIKARVYHVDSPFDLFEPGNGSACDAPLRAFS